MVFDKVNTSPEVLTYWPGCEVALNTVVDMLPSGACVETVISRVVRPIVVLTVVCSFTIATPVLVSVVDVGI